MASYGQTDARTAVSGPATALLVTGILGIVLQIFGLGWTIVMVPIQQKEMEKVMQKERERQQKQGPVDPMAAQQAQQQDQMMQMMSMLSGTAGIVSGTLGIVTGVVIIFGAMKMKTCQSYGLSMATSILAMIPCLSPCCPLGLPFGIWALVVLSKPEVKAAFR